MPRRRNQGQISTFNIPFFESADPFVDLLTETASRMRANASRLTLVKNCRPFAARQRSNVKCLDATPGPRCSHEPIWATRPLDATPVFPRFWWAGEHNHARLEYGLPRWRSAARPKPGDSSWQAWHRG